MRQKIENSCQLKLKFWAHRQTTCPFKSDSNFLATPLPPYIYTQDYTTVTHLPPPDTAPLSPTAETRTPESWVYIYRGRGVAKRHMLVVLNQSTQQLYIMKAPQVLMPRWRHQSYLCCNCTVMASRLRNYKRTDKQTTTITNGRPRTFRYNYRAQQVFLEAIY